MLFYACVVRINNIVFKCSFCEVDNNSIENENFQDIVWKGIISWIALWNNFSGWFNEGGSAEIFRKVKQRQDGATYLDWNDKETFRWG